MKQKMNTYPLGRGATVLKGGPSALDILGKRMGVGEWAPPTGIAKEVHEWLHERAKSVLGKSGKTSQRTAKAVAERCSAISVCKAFEHVDPRALALEMGILVDKGLVVEFTLYGLPSFIPVSYCSVEVVTTRPLTQADIDNG